jgi:uncharacterized membrane protein YbaN (DUF454 family)
MIYHLKHLLLLSIGWLFVLIGIAGIFIPLIPGLPFLFIGLTLLSVSSVWIRKHVEYVLEKHPSFISHHKKADTFIRRIFRLESI